MPYNGYNDKIKASNKRYMDKLKRVVIWCYPDEKAEIERKALEAGKSVNAYCKDVLLGESDDLQS